MEKRIQAAYEHVDSKLFYQVTMPGGTHYIKEVEVQTIAKHMRIMEGDNIWEIGMGKPFLAFSLSAASNGGKVVATDIGTWHHTHILPMK